MLRGNLPRVMCHQEYKHTKTKNMEGRNLAFGSGVLALGAQLRQIEVVAHVVVELPLPSNVEYVYIYMYVYIYSYLWIYTYIYL